MVHAVQPHLMCRPKRNLTPTSIQQCGVADEAWAVLLEHLRLEIWVSAGSRSYIMRFRLPSYCHPLTSGCRQRTSALFDILTAGSDPAGLGTWKRCSQRGAKPSWGPPQTHLHALKVRGSSTRIALTLAFGSAAKPMADRITGTSCCISVVELRR
jgi:hypothetical protein